MNPYLFIFILFSMLCITVITIITFIIKDCIKRKEYVGLLLAMPLSCYCFVTFFIAFESFLKLLHLRF